MHKSSERCEKSDGDIVTRIDVERRGGILLRAWQPQAARPGAKADANCGGGEESGTGELPFLSVGDKIVSTQKENLV
jgi:hypothetical protein